MIVDDFNTDLPENTDELLLRIESEWSKLIQLVEQLTPEQMTMRDQAGWSPKDNLAHLSEWLKGLVGYILDRRPADEVMGFPEMTALLNNLNVINAVLLARNRDRGTEEVVDELKQSHADFLARLRSMPFEELMRARTESDPQQRPVLLWVLADTVGHWAEHRANIARTVGISEE